MSLENIVPFICYFLPEGNPRMSYVEFRKQGADLCLWFLEEEIEKQRVYYEVIPQSSKEGWDTFCEEGSLACSIKSDLREEFYRGVLIRDRKNNPETL